MSPDAQDAPPPTEPAHELATAPPEPGPAADLQRPVETEASTLSFTGKVGAFLAAEPGFRALLRDAYFQFDRRTLGVTRICLGFLMVMDLVHRAPVWNDLFSTVGVLPNDVNLWKNGGFSLFNAFSTPAEVCALWLVMMATGLCLLVGYRTKVAQVAALVFVASMNDRIGMIMNGGYVVNNLLFLWTAFLPLGDRFSVDALSASMRARREATAEELNDRSGRVPEGKRGPHTTALGPVLLVQLAAIYYFNVLHKTGADWHNGRAVHYVLYADRMVTPLVAKVRDHLPNWTIQVMTRSTMAFESLIPFCLLTPVGRVWARRAAIAMINLLHLAFGTAMTLGPFAWSLCVFSTLLFGAEDWELAEQTMRRAHRARTLVFARGSGAALWACRLLQRLDGFGLLTFRAEDEVAGGLRVEGRPGAVLPASAALADVLAALPLGPAIAWVPRLPLVRTALDALLARLGRVALSRVLGLRVPGRSAVPSPGGAIGRFGRGGVIALREAALLVMFAGSVNQAAVELWVVNRRVHVTQPEPMRLLAQKFNFSQGWFMFCPVPVMDDGTVVVDAVTRDGRHVDPFTGKPPDFDLLHAQSLMDALGSGQIWGDYFNRIQMPGNSGYRDAMKAYLLRYPERTGRREDALASADVYWVHDQNPKWNDIHSYGLEKNKLFSFEAPPSR